MILDSKNQIDTLASESAQKKLYEINLPTEENSVGQIPLIETNWHIKTGILEDGGESEFYDQSNARSGSMLSDNSGSYKSEYDSLGKILVVDDEQYNLDVMKAFFEILRMHKI